jgi:hypothetical protein
MFAEKRFGDLCLRVAANNLLDAPRQTECARYRGPLANHELKRIENRMSNDGRRLTVELRGNF